MAFVRKVFVGMCNDCRTLTALPQAQAQALVDAAPKSDALDIDVTRCAQVVVIPGPPPTVGRCTGTIKLVGQLRWLARDLPYE